MKKTAWIGVGNMGGALLEAAAKSLRGEDIFLADQNTARVEALTAALGCTAGSTADAAKAAEYLVIGVKPQAAAGLFDEIRPVLEARRNDPPILVTMMAGRTMETVRGLAGYDIPVIRIMPNVAASVGAAMILCDSVGVSEENKAEFEAFMKEAGRLDWLPEALIDAGASVSGCGPAYVCLFAEALADGAVKCGVPRKKALEYAIQTLYGTAKLLAESGRHPAVVKDEVTSPAGTTIEGIEALEENGFRYAVMQAVVRSFEKNRKL